jgi:hypothetical protein
LENPVLATATLDPAGRFGRGMRLAMSWVARGAMSRSETQIGFSMAIAGVSRVAPTAQEKQSAGDAGAKAAGGALVPVVASPRRHAPPCQGLTPPDPSFVTHLIAMAELSPQTRLLRRAAPADVQAAYRSVADQNRTATPGVRMRQFA